MADFINFLYFYWCIFSHFLHLCYSGQIWPDITLVIILTRLCAPRDVKKKKTQKPQTVTCKKYSQYICKAYVIVITRHHLRAYVMQQKNVHQVVGRYNGKWMNEWYYVYQRTGFPFTPTTKWLLVHTASFFAWVTMSESGKASHHKWLMSHLPQMAVKCGYSKANLKQDAPLLHSWNTMISVAFFN